MSNLEEIQQPIQNPNNQSSKSTNTGRLSQTSISHSFWSCIFNKLIKIKISMITLLRLIILFTFFVIYSFYPFAASLLFMANFVLDYLYWAIVSQNGGGTILAECLDWIADILSALILPFFLYTIESQYLLFYLFFLCIKWWHFFAQLTGRQSQMNKLRKFTTSKGHKKELKQNWYDMKSPNKKINHFISHISGLIRVNASSFACNCLLFINYVPSLTRYLMCSSLTTKIRRAWRRQPKNRTQIKFSIKQMSSQQCDQMDLHGIQNLN